MLGLQAFMRSPPLSGGLLCLLAACGDNSPQEPGDVATERIVFLSFRTGFAQIYGMDADGSDMTAISNEPTAQYDRLEVSRSTGRILYRKSGGATPSGVYWTDGSRIAGPLPDASEYRWSPDGSRLAFTNNTEAEPARHVFVVNADGSGLLQLTEGAESDAAPAWSPDGTKLVFQRNLAGSPESQLYLINVDGTALTPLAAGAMPSWSPDGSRIGFLTGSGLWTVGADGTTAQQVSTARCTGKPPVWSPTNSHLLCVGPSSSGLALPSFLYRVKADGSESLNLTPQGLDPTVYSWSQNGTRILYDDRAADERDVFLMNADGSAVHNLTSDPEGALQPFWTLAP